MKAITMSPKKQKFYYDAICSVYPDATGIHTPRLLGSLNNVLMAETGSGERVFKFSDKDLVIKNAKVSYLYNKYQIPVPQITPQYYKDLCFEDYEKISGTTLYEAIKDGIGADQVKSVYRQVVDLLYKMEKIHPDALGNGNMHAAHTIAAKHTIKTHGLLIGQMVWATVYLANNNSRDKFSKGIYHFDLSPKNILISDDGQLKALLDMDSVGICSFPFAFGMLAARYQQYGMDITDLFKYYNTLNDEGLDYDAIKRIAKIRSLLFQKHK